jgi:hypothetical protein
MAVVQGVQEKLHLPLYDSVFVRPKEQLRDIESSSVLRFFVNVQGKTKLETNMQSSSLLPHWNTFEARALRVVVSDLPAILPEEITNCFITPDTGDNSEVLTKLQGCIKQLCGLIEEQKKWSFQNKQKMESMASVVTEFNQLVDKTQDINVDIESCMGYFRALSDENSLGKMLDLHSELKASRSDLLNILQKTRIKASKSTGIQRFIKKLQAFTENNIEKILYNSFKQARPCCDDFLKMAALIKRIQSKDNKELNFYAERFNDFVQWDKSCTGALEQVKHCLSEVEQDFPKAIEDNNHHKLQQCLHEKHHDIQSIPLNEQLTGNSATLLSKLVYNSITTFSVGEKIMMQMPTWFFPSGGGPYSEDGNVVTHGFPSPEATFRFSEPVMIDTKQNFRVEIEIPEANQFKELQRIYGPFFIWVVLDGYMARDVQ